MIGVALLASSGARLAPGGDDAGGAIGERGIAGGLADRRVELRQRHLRIAHQAECVRVAAAKLQRIDVDLHHLGI